MTKAIIGTYTTGPQEGRIAHMDVDELVRSRLLLQANSGGGKSYALRKLMEECAPHIQVLLIDREGEFSTLREKYDFLHFGRVEHGADFDVSIKIANHLPRRLMELGASAILDLSELSIHEQILFVKRFCEGMIALPKNLWKPVLIGLDEIHKFCPQKEKCESAPAVIDMASLGRKRGQALVGATQRLSKLNKDCAAELLNKMVGRTGLDLDMDRAADELGIRSKEKRQELRDLKPGEFFVFGPAFNPGVNRVRIGKVQTTHPQIGQRLGPVSTPPPEKIKSMLSKLADIAEKADEKEKTDADLKRELAELGGTRLALEQKVKKLEADTSKGVKERVVERKEYKMPPNVNLEIERIRHALGRIDKEMGKKPERIVQRATIIDQKVKTLEQAKKVMTRTLTGEVPLRDGAMRMLKAAALFPSRPISKHQVATIAGMSPTSGTFSTYLGELRRQGWMDVQGHQVSITPDGLRNAGDTRAVSVRPEDLLALWKPKFRDGAARMLQICYDAYPNQVTKEDLGEAAGISPSSGTFGTYLGELRRNGLVIVTKQSVRATPELFPGTKG